MSLNHSIIGKCIICDDDVYESERSVKSSEGICHQRCVFGSAYATKA